MTILMNWRVVLLILLVCVLPAAACAPAAALDGPTPLADAGELPARLKLPAGYGAEVLVSGLSGPMQMAQGPRNTLWVVQMAGNENAGTGQVVVIDFESRLRRVAVDGLLRPTGLALAGGYLWIAAKRDLLRVPLDEEGVSGPAETVLHNLPFDGRSNGTLTATPEHDVLFETSGTRFGAEPLTGSATLWRLDPANPTEPEPLAGGLKGAYSHAFDAQGRLWVTEISGDVVNGVAPPDELNLVAPGADFGWPQCFGDQQPALNYGGTQVHCLGTRPPVALFAPRAAPTSVAVSPWADDELFVALRGEGVIVRVQVEQAGDNAVGTVTPFIEGLRRPQDLLPWGKDSLLIAEQATGNIYRVYPVP